MQGDTPDYHHHAITSLWSWSSLNLPFRSLPRLVPCICLAVGRAFFVVLKSPARMMEAASARRDKETHRQPTALHVP
jgi:hypothetical protein